MNPNRQPILDSDGWPIADMAAGSPWVYKSKVIKVVDGDTIDFVVDHGMDMGIEAVHNIPRHLAGVIITIFAVTYAIETCRRPAIQDKLIVLRDRLLDVAFKMCREANRMDIYLTILD